MIGREILEFRVERLLAQGGMGAVYLARHVRLPGTLKVIKVLLPEYADHAVVRQRFHREAEAASRLRHESILGIDNFGALDDGQLFIMTPFLDGRPLDAYLRSRGGRLSPHRSLHLAVQLCDALDHAHARGVIHRDLKPGNVYVVATNANPYALKLLDFGIAKLSGDDAPGPQTRSGVAIGTPAYMAVEEYEHADEVTHLADLYSLAVVIWEVVTGRLPWPHSDPTVLYYQQRTTVPERPPADVMPPAWAEVLLSALRPDPSTRPQSARELAVALASALPAIGRAPSGAEILAGLAPHFVRSAAPGDETVRNAADVERIGPLLWPPRETAPEPPLGPSRETAPEPPLEPPLGPPAAQRRGPGSAASPGPRSGPPSELPTTLSAASGVARSPAERRAARWKLALAALGSAALAAVATSSIARHAATSAPAPQLAPAAAPAPSASPAAPPSPPTLQLVPAATPAPRAPSPQLVPAAAPAPRASPAASANPPTTAPPPAAPAALPRPSPAVRAAGSAAPGVRSSRATAPAAAPSGSAAGAARGAPRPPAIDPDDVSGLEE